MKARVVERTINIACAAMVNVHRKEKMQQRWGGGGWVGREQSQTRGEATPGHSGEGSLLQNVMDGQDVGHKLVQCN